MKQHTTPLIIRDEKVEKLERISLNSGVYDESWVQELCFRYPNILPLEEIEPACGSMIPICRELVVESGSIDLIYVNASGFITIGECKLWRNPEARRKVVGQILDYAKDLSKWNYSKFSKECLRSLKAASNTKSSLYDIVHKSDRDDKIEASQFADNVQKNLKKGRFLLAIIGDGIRENMEELVAYIHRNANLNFTLGLIEMPIYRNSSNDLVITPRVIAKTVEIERVVYRIAEGSQEQNEPEDEQPPKRQSISSQVFFERLSTAIGQEKTKQVQHFIDDLSDKLNIVTILGRGKRLSLNFKSSSETYNFASLQENGQVWFYGIVSRTEDLGDKQIGIDYLKALASAIGGKFYDSYSTWQWCVKKNGKYVNIIEYLEIKEKWIKIISDTLDKINRFEENNRS